MKKLIFLILMLSLFLYCGPKEGKVEKIMVDGVAHIKNPEKPLKGEITLDIEKTREINPYQFEEVGLRRFSFIRDADGGVILFDSNRAEAQRFNKDGKYKGKLFRNGQGPGEFPEGRMFSVCFMNNQIWATGDMKFAKYDKNGQFLYERRIGYRPEFFVDENTFFINKRINNKDGWLNKISLVNLSPDRDSESSIIDFFHEKNVGMIQSKDRGGGFADSWGTPDIRFIYDQQYQKLSVALNTEYEIYVKNLKGETLYVIERPYKYVKVSLEDKKKLLPWAAEEESWRWALSAYPDNLVAIKGMKTLPNGYLAVYRVSGLETVEVDVFDQEGRFVYIMKPPHGVSLERVKFYSFGFATKETKEDGLELYTEYKIKNLPDIFK
ncbi:MAG: 6-bladed beta-propeller [Candidatus Aminicenantes bacterium]|nr:MAG: 6-bladed beta-propeller [Candidatus Aminicenantes bacterium]